MNKQVTSEPSKVQMLELLEELNSPSIPTRILWMELNDAITPDAEGAAMAKAVTWLRKRGYHPW